MNPITSFFQIFIVIDNIVHMFLLMIAHSNIVKVLSETAFLSIVENKQWFFSCSYSFDASSFPLIEDLSYFPVQNNLSLVFILLSVVYIWPGPNDFCFFKSKSTTPWTMFIKSWTFWAVVANARAKENWVLLNDGYAESLLLENSVSF